MGISHTGIEDKDKDRSSTGYSSLYIGLRTINPFCNNLEGAKEEAICAYRETINGLTTEQINHIKVVGTNAVYMQNGTARINDEYLMNTGLNESPQVHKAMSYRTRLLRAERQLALQIPKDYHRDYTELRKLIKARTPIKEIEQELPSFWIKLRTTFLEP